MRYTSGMRHSLKLRLTQDIGKRFVCSQLCATAFATGVLDAVALPGEGTACVTDQSDET